MDGETTEIRYQQWADIIQDWSNSGLTKRDYCQQNGIDEKRLYYYQRRIRALIAARAAQQALPDSGLGVFPVSASTVKGKERPQIVRLHFPNMTMGDKPMVTFSVNEMTLTVPEDIPAPFLGKLLEAACHGSR